MSTVDLTRTQLALLRIMRDIPGPTLSEIYKYAPAYEIPRDRLREDYITLLLKRLIRPIAISIRPDVYLPTSCIITEDGKEILKALVKDSRLPARNIYLLFKIATEEPEPKIEDVIEGWPRLNQCNKDEVKALAETYYHWAEIYRRWAQTGVSPAEFYGFWENLYYEAARGFAAIGDKTMFKKSLAKCFDSCLTKGNLSLLFLAIFRALKDFPDYMSSIFSLAHRFLSDIYLKIVRKPLPPITSESDLIRIVKELLNHEADLLDRAVLGH